MPRKGKNATESDDKSFMDCDFINVRTTKVLGVLANFIVFPFFSKNNCLLCAMQMQVSLEAHELWEAIETETMARKKD